MSGYYVDISQFQPETIDWQAYKKWSEQWDGVSRVAMRSSYGTGFTDTQYKAHRANAEKVGIDVNIHYHYAYPQLNQPQAEADWQKQVVGTVRANDLIMLDMEEQASQATGEWAFAWLGEQEKDYNGVAYGKPLIYASQAYCESRLTKLELARYGLVLAHWNIAEMPASPIPWPKYAALQLSNQGSIPGIAGKVDLNLWCL